MQVSSRDQFRRNVRLRPARRRSNSHLISISANIHSASFAATVLPDVAEESASSSKSYEQSNNKATIQQSTGASHIQPCYPEKTINCSNGVLGAAVSHPVFIAHMLPLTAVSLTAEEWKARVDLAAIYRICHNLGLNEGINNHLTATIPGMPGHFLVFPFGLLWSEVTASNLLLMDNKVCCAAVPAKLPLNLALLLCAARRWLNSSTKYILPRILYPSGIALHCQATDFETQHCSGNSDSSSTCIISKCLRAGKCCTWQRASRGHSILDPQQNS